MQSDSNLLKRIEDLESQVKELKSQKKDNLSLFGRSYSQVGNSNSDFLIKTKGQVKIQWGTMFIDLIKDGKINVNSKFLYKEDSVGTKDGIYVIGEGEEAEIWLVVSGIPINLKGTIGNTYVSFLGEQETTSQQKRTALTNIGFIYPDIASVNADAIQNGAIYVESEHKLYLVTNGSLEEFKVSVPNPFPDQFVIAKTTDETGAIVIQGTGISNSLAFSDFYIYSGGDASVIQSDKELQIKASLLDIISSKVKIGGTLKVGIVESISDPLDTGGFRIYKDSNGDSVLEIDRVLERDSDQNNLFPEYWLLNNNIIKAATTPDSGDEASPAVTEEVTITFAQEHSYKQGDILAIYKKDIQDQPEGQEEVDDSNSYSLTLLEVSSAPDSNTIQVVIPGGVDENFTDGLVGQFTFLVKSTDGKLPIRLKDNNIDIVEYNVNGDQLQGKVKTRIGDLSSIENEGLEGHGIYTDHLILGGTSDKDYPKYTDTLGGLVSAIKIEETDSYNCVLVPIGLLKAVLKESQDAIKELKEKVQTMQTDIDDSKQKVEALSTPDEGA